MSALPGPSLPAWLPIAQGVLVVVVASSLVAVRYFSGTRWGDRLRARFVLGVPWGTLLTAAGLVAVYLFLQHGLEHPRDPLVLPFVSWSLLYPIGTLLSPFSHAGVGHITGNLFGTLALASVAEYAWGHFPRARGSQSFSAWRTNPYVRIFAVPAASIVVGVLTGVFSFGPAIGFSGVVFAFAGFALVRYPLATVLVLLGRRIVGLVYQAFRNPGTTASGHTQFVTPWWANVAIHGHFFGFVLGATVALVLLRSRDRRPDPGRLFFAILVVTVSQGLWALWIPSGGNSYHLFRAYGVAALFLLATLVTTAAAASRKDLIARVGLDRREAAVGVVLALVLALGLVAVPFNLFTIAGHSGVDDGVHVRDYTVTYAEDVPNRYVPAFTVPFYNVSEQYNASGVIVTSERRHVWFETVSTGALRRDGNRTVTVGGIGWERTVVANRTGWSVVGNGSTYKIYLRPEGGHERLVYTADPVRAGPVVAGRNVTIRPTADAFELVVTNETATLGREPLYRVGNRTRVGGLTFNRTGPLLRVRGDGTRLEIAERETH